jgi:hypothetical protein
MKRHAMPLRIPSDPIKSVRVLLIFFGKEIDRNGGVSADRIKTAKRFLQVSKAWISE